MTFQSDRPIIRVIDLAGFALEDPEQAGCPEAEELQDIFVRERRDDMPPEVLMVADESANWPWPMRLFLELGIAWGIRKGVEITTTKITPHGTWRAGGRTW